MRHECYTKKTCICLFLFLMKPLLPGFVNTPSTSSVPVFVLPVKMLFAFQGPLHVSFSSGNPIWSSPSHSYAMLITLSREHHKFPATLHPAYFISFLMREINLAIFVFPQHLPLCFLHNRHSYIFLYLTNDY